MSKGLETIAKIIVGDTSLVFKKIEKLMEWLHEQINWVATDYKDRTIEEIVKRRAGNCAEHARVFLALLDVLNIKSRWVLEIMTSPESKERQADAEELMDKWGNKASMFGLIHNDHRWIEVYDEQKDIWFPADSTFGIVGMEEWVDKRLSFSQESTAHSGKIPLFIAIVSNDEIIEIRSEEYMIDNFNNFYDNRLKNLSSWKKWTSAIDKLSDIAPLVFDGKLNFHTRLPLIREVITAYNKLLDEGNFISE